MALANGKPDNIQALAASEEYLQKIPHKYIRPEMIVQADVVVDINSEDDHCIPVVDLGRLLDPLSSDDEAAKLKMACEDWGFFQLINHGIPNEVITSMKTDIEKFFGLSLEEKQAPQLPGIYEGFGKAFVMGEDQKLDWGDMYVLGTLPVTSRNMRMWPTNPPTFRTTLDKYALESKKVTDCLLGWMAKNLGLEEEKLTDLFKDCLQTVRINYYPPCPEADKVLGLSPHSDSLALTLLLEVNEVQGLQINRNGRWIPIQPVSGAIVVNIGDMLEILSNGKYKSIEHRAIINPKKERLSIAAFHAPNPSAMIGPLPELLEGSEEQRYYKTVSFEGYRKLIVSTKLDGKSLVDQMKLNN